jgi:hypothetical protein
MLENHKTYSKEFALKRTKKTFPFKASKKEKNLPVHFPNRVFPSGRPPWFEKQILAAGFWKK